MALRGEAQDCTGAIGTWCICAQLGQVLDCEHYKDPGEACVWFIFYSLMHRKHSGLLIICTSFETVIGCRQT